MDLSKDRQQKIINALETYFSDASLQWDKVMQSKILADPRASKELIFVTIFSFFFDLTFCLIVVVSFEELSRLPKLRKLQATATEIQSLAKEHSLSRLQVLYYLCITRQTNPSTNI